MPEHVRPQSVMHPYDYRSVTLRASVWKAQVDRAVETYLSLPEDDILHGFRARNGQRPAGRPLTGWCATDAAVVFGQWLSGFARLGAATGDHRLADKALRLMRGWAETLDPDGGSPLDHYGFDKTLGGLVDIAIYLETPEAMLLARRLTEWAMGALDRENVPAVTAHRSLHSGHVPEWYTLAENLYRASLVSGDRLFADFARAWHYDDFWAKFEATDAPTGAWGVHAYSHLNSFSSAAAAYEAGAYPAGLEVARHAYRYFVESQCYATGGFGPAERLQPPGGLGHCLDRRMDDFEAPCGSWAAFKLAKYLVRLTGEAGPGDWVERLLHNGIGAALGTQPDGRHFYYADYRVSGAVKAYNRDTFACCSGTYLQDVADYFDQIFFHDDRGIAVAQFLPADLSTTWRGTAVRIGIDACLPAGGDVRLTVDVARPVRFALAIRCPGWAGGQLDLTVNGAPQPWRMESGWIRIDREWQGVEHVDLHLPLEWRREVVDPEHPDRFALMRGPAVYVLDAWRHESVPDALEAADAPAADGSFAIKDRAGVPFDARLRPFRDVPEGWSYRMYLDETGSRLYPS